MELGAAVADDDALLVVLLEELELEDLLVLLDEVVELDEPDVLLNEGRDAVEVWEAVEPVVIELPVAVDSIVNMGE